MTKSLEQKNLLKRLQQANAGENLTLFVGAGVSKTVPGSKAKLWSDLVKEMQDILKTNETDPLCLAQMLAEQCPEKYDDITRNSIDSTERISDVHRLIAKLKPRIIITTNWDCLLEKALEFSWYDTITCDEELLKSQRDHKLIKMHGDFARADNRFVFKEDDYLNYAQNYPLIETFVKNAIVTTNVLFIGYSYSDINLKMIMTWLKHNRKQKDRPLHIIAQYEANDIKTKYFKNWGIETYFCDDTHQPANTFDLSDDENHCSYRLYNFLNEIYLIDKISTYDIESLWAAYEPYISLHVVPFKIITDFLPYFQIKCNSTGNLFLSLSYCNSHDESLHILFDQLKQYIEAQKNNDVKKIKELPEHIENLINFWLNAGILSISIIDPSHHPIIKELTFDFMIIESNYDCHSDIENFLSFKNTLFDEHYDEQEQIKRISLLFKNREIAECLIESENLYTYHMLKSYGKDDPHDIYIININEIVDVLPKFLQRKYKSLVDVLTFDDIKNKSKNLYAEISTIFNYLNQRKNQERITLHNVDPTLKIREMQNYLNFFWENNLCVEYYTEVKEYVYLTLKYLFFSYYQMLSSILDKEKYNQFLKTPPAVTLRRLELSALLHFSDEKRLGELLDKDTYLLDGPVKLAILPIDISWLIDTVLPNLILHVKEPINLLDGTARKQRVGYVFKILSVAEHIDTISFKKIFEFLLSEKLILKEPFTILSGITFFFENRKTDLLNNKESSAKFIISFLQMSVKYFKENGHNIYTSNAFSQVCSIVFNFISYIKCRIPENIVDAIMEYYLTLDIEEKCSCIQCLILICSDASDNKKKEIGKMLNNYIMDIDKNSVNPVMYVIFRIYLVCLHINELTFDLLTEISSNMALRPQPGSWNSSIDLLLSLLKTLVSQTSDPTMLEQLNGVIQVLTPKYCVD